MPDALISYPRTKDGVHDALKALGSSADSVARNLDAMGFKGCRSKEYRCPIANYLLAAVADAQRVSVCFGDVDVWGPDGERVTAPWTDAVEDFVEYFDNGALPQLETPDASS